MEVGEGHMEVGEGHMEVAICDYIQRKKKRDGN